MHGASRVLFGKPQGKKITWKLQAYLGGDILSIWYRTGQKAPLVNKVNELLVP